MADPQKPKKIILPDDPQFRNLLPEAKSAFLKSQKLTTNENFDSKPHGVDLKWVKIEKSRYELDYTTDAMSDDQSKIVFHFKRITAKDMERLAGFLYYELTERVKPQAQIEAGISPIFKNQWDLILFLVPTFQVQIVRDQILHLLDIFDRTK